MYIIIFVSILQSSAAAPRPAKPTFPAYSSSAATAPSSSSTISAPPTIKKPESSSGMSVKLIHPDEDISLVSVLNLFYSVKNSYAA